MVGLMSAYYAAQAVVLTHGFGQELESQRSVSPVSLTESRLLREAAWVILGCGLSARVVAARFHHLSSAFLDWRSAAEIAADAQACRCRALKHFSHPGKIDAILVFTSHVTAHSFDQVRSRVMSDPIGYLSQFPYFGPATSLHLAKNIGLQVAKPDRHLVRLAHATGYTNPAHLCADISRSTGDPVAVVDLVLWRYATLVRSAAQVFAYIVKESGTQYPSAATHVPPT